MHRHENIGTAALKALAIVVAFTAAAHAAMPYLPLVGPPALRLQKVRPPATATVKFSPVNAPPAAETNAVAAADSTNPAKESAAAGTGSAAGPIHSEAETPLSDSFTASIFELPTPDLVGISPQMLATYFRPLQHGTNMVPVGMFPLSFLPPIPPDKSSHAEYIVK